MAPHLRLVPAPGDSDASTEGTKAPALTAAQRALVKAALPMVEASARQIAWKYRPLVKAEDLLAPGTIALHEAALTYRAELHPDFATFARHHVRGQMFDAIRAEHFSLRARVERAMERSFARISSHQTLEVNLFMDDDETVAGAARTGTDDALAAAVLAGLLEAQQAPSAEDVVIAVESRTLALEALKQAITTLYRHEREVIRLVYQEGMTLDAVAKKISVHLRTVKLRHVSGLRKLRAALIEGEIGVRMWAGLHDSSALPEGRTAPR